MFPGPALTLSVWVSLSYTLHITYGRDDSSGKEEGTSEIPVAWVVGGVADRTHSSIHSLHWMLERGVQTEQSEKLDVSLVSEDNVWQ